MTKPFILLTGDDSVRSEGIILIKRIVQEFADYQIVATHDQMSGVGAAMTFRGGPWGKETVDGDHEAIWVEGYPSDAVYFAFKYLDRKPDLVISGMNHGENVEDATMIRSGTIGAAHTASATRGVPTIAFSKRVTPGDWDKNHDGEFDEYLLKYPGLIIEQVIKKALKYKFPKDSFWNVNFPAKETSVLKVVPTNFHGSYPNEQAIDQTKYWYDFEVKYTGWREGTDAGEMERGHATLTPCKINFTIDSELNKLEKYFQSS
jgi:5'-nucleotidase